MENLASLSIIIPVGPVETAHLGLLQRLLDFPARRLDAPVQIVLSGCETATSETSCRSTDGIKYIQVSGSPGRAVQLNRGVARSTGRCLWLLHADSCPTPDAMASAAIFAGQSNDAARAGLLGWFPLSFGRDGPRLAALNAAGANARSLVLRLPFGDQGWLLFRDTFELLGGFDEQFGRGEDLDFICRARHSGVRLQRQDAMLETSARRYRKQGWLRTTLGHLGLTLRLWLKSRRKLRNPLN